MIRLKDIIQNDVMSMESFDEKPLGGPTVDYEAIRKEDATEDGLMLDTLEETLTTTDDTEQEALETTQGYCLFYLPALADKYGAHYDESKPALENIHNIRIAVEAWDFSPLKSFKNTVRDFWAKMRGYDFFKPIYDNDYFKNMHIEDYQRQVQEINTYIYPNKDALRIFTEELNEVVSNLSDKELTYTFCNNKLIDIKSFALGAVSVVRQLIKRTQAALDYEDNDLEKILSGINYKTLSKDLFNTEIISQKGKLGINVTSPKRSSKITYKELYTELYNGGKEMPHFGDQLRDLESNLNDAVKKIDKSDSEAGRKMVNMVTQLALTLFGEVIKVYDQYIKIYMNTIKACKNNPEFKKLELFTAKGTNNHVNEAFKKADKASLFLAAAAGVLTVSPLGLVMFPYITATAQNQNRYNKQVVEDK